MFWLSCVFFAAVFGSVKAWPVPQECGNYGSDLIVDIGYAKYQGFYDPTLDSNTWLGISTAEPITRFQKAVRPTTAGNGTVLSALQKGPHCAQVSASAGQPVSNSSAGAEDCLFVNVYAPKNATLSGEAAPVVIWIYGGGYGYGYPDAFGNVSNVIPVDQGKTILVTIQYRTDVFGFLSGKDIQAKGFPNLGIYDQLFGIQWVHDYICLFGGDPTHVTIWGESAGGGSVMMLTMAYGGSLGTSLWNATISNSPYLPLQYNYDDSVPQNYYDTLVNTTGCAGEQDQFTCLSTKPYETVFEAAVALNKAIAPYGTWGPGPVTDGLLLPGTPSVSLYPGQVNAEYIFAGHTTHEGSNFVPPDLNTTEDFESWFRQLYPSVTSDLLQVIEGYYPDPNASNGAYTTQTGRAAAVYGDTTFRCPAYWLALSFPNGKGWKYITGVGTGTHGSDLEIFFLTAPGPGYDLASAHEVEVGSLSSFWQHFDPAYSPALSGLGFSPYDAASNYEQLFYEMTGANNETVPVIEYEGIQQPAECTFWRSVGPLVPI